MKTPRKNVLEWLTFGVGTALVLATVVFLAISAWRFEDTPPVVEIGLGTPQARHGRFDVPVTAKNRGTQPAEQIEIEVTLKSASGAEERATLHLDFLARQSERKGWVSFFGDPSRGTLSARPRGFQAP